MEERNFSSKEEKIAYLREQIRAAEEEEESEKETKAQGAYEELILDQPMALNIIAQDQLDFKFEKIKDTPNEQLIAILHFFNGKSITQKRKQLNQFLKYFPICRSLDKNTTIRRMNLIRDRARELMDIGVELLTEPEFFQKLDECGFIYKNKG